MFRSIAAYCAGIQYLRGDSFPSHTHLPQIPYVARRIPSPPGYAATQLHETVAAKEKKDGDNVQYRKKPVVIEAYQTDKEMIIHTLEGDMKASVGDYIITGVNGEQYPCKPDIFEKTYEPV